MSVSSMSGHRIGTCWPWQIEFVDTKAATVLVLSHVSGLHEPTRHVVERLPGLRTCLKYLFELRFLLVSWIATWTQDKVGYCRYGFPTFICGIDFCLVWRYAKQVHLTGA